MLRLNAKKQTEKYTLNMIMVFKVLEIVCYSNEMSYEKASLAWDGIIHNIETRK